MKRPFIYPQNLGTPPRIGYWTVKEMLILSPLLIVSVLFFIRSGKTWPLVTTILITLLVAGKGRTRVGDGLIIPIRYILRPKRTYWRLKKGQDVPPQPVRICTRSITGSTEKEIEDIYRELSEILLPGEEHTITTAAVRDNRKARELRLRDKLDADLTEGERRVILSELEQIRKDGERDLIGAFYLRKNEQKGDN